MELTTRFETMADLGAAGLSNGSLAGPGPDGPGPHEASAADRATQRDELRAALGSLGYGNEEVRQVLARLPVEGTTEEMLRFALRELAGSQ
jgi:hypothetical protein